MPISQADVQIVLSARDQASGVVRRFGSNAERAMRQAEASTGGLNRSIALLRRAIAPLAAGFGAWKIGSWIKDSGSLAMRYETLGVVMRTVGNNAGYAGEQMEGFQKRLESAGISMVASRDTLIRMTQANMDLEKATQLARVAQDAAVIGNINSSEAFERMIYGIQSAKVEMLRTIGINVNFENSYQRVAKETGRAVTSFTEAEKAQIRMNTVLAAGAGIAGTYEAAMGTAGKQAGSLERHLENLKVMAGQALTPALTEIIEALTGAVTDLNGELSGEGKEAIEKWGINFRLAIISIRAEFLRLAMLLDRIGQGAGAVGMGLTGVGSALGIESSKKRFEAAAQMYIDYEERYKQSENELLKLAVKYNEIEASLTPAGRAAAKARADALEMARLKSRPTGAAGGGQPADPKAAQEAEKRLKRGQDLILSMTRERDLIRAVTREEAVRWELSQGRDQDLSEPHKQKILAVAKELDALNAVIKAEEERAAILKSIDDEIASLQKETDTFGMTEGAAKRYEMALKGATDTQMESIEILTRDLEIKKQVAQVLEDIKTPLDEYAGKIRILNDLLAMGEISQDQYAQAVAKYRKHLEDAAKDQQSMTAELKQAIEGWGRDSANALVEFATGGKASFKDFADSVIKDILRMLVYQKLMKPLFSGGESGTGWVGTAFSAVMKIFGSAQGNVFSGGRLIPFAQGGIVDRPVVFRMAHGMGLMGEAGPEAVLPLARLPGGDLGVKTTGAAREKAPPPQHIRIINVLDPGIVENWASSAAGERVIMNVIRRNQ